jgi:acyl carrier protein phosphodiesterase
LNWLSHLHLGGTDPIRRLGHLSGDFVRGADLGRLPPLLVRGIAEHRQIDAFTDAHPLVRRSRARIDGPLRRYAGVLVDVFYDHVLAADWGRHAPGRPPLRTFVDLVYADLNAHRELLPERLAAIAPRMITEDGLASYGSIAGLRGILRRMEGRLRRPVALAAGAALLERQRAAFAADFAEFYPELRAFAAALAEG